MILSNSSRASDKLYVDDVFSTYLYTGNGSSQTINNGIDLAGKGGMVWCKGRNVGDAQRIFDIARGAGYELYAQSGGASVSNPIGLTSFNSNGFTLGSGNPNLNSLSQTYVSWTFREAPKFFDVVTWSGNNVVGRRISHSLGVKPGLIIVKCTNTSGDWFVVARDDSSVQWRFLLNSTAATNGGTTDPIGYWTTTDFSLAGVASGSDVSATLVNASGNSYIAYLFAHDTSAEGMIRCGSFTTDASGNATVNLGWEPQYVLSKASSTTSNWFVVDSMRGMPVSGSDQRLCPNLSAAEDTSSNVAPTATGFNAVNMGASLTYIYMAIRRSNKPPTSGTQVFSVNTSNSAAGTAITTGFPVDLQISSNRSTFSSIVCDRLRGLSTTTTEGEKSLVTSTTAVEVDSLNKTRGFNNTGFQMPSYYSGASTIFWNFKRASGVFDAVCFTTATSASTTIAHNLTTTAELIIVKERNLTNDWFVYVQDGGVNKYLKLNADMAYQTFANTWAVSSTGFGFAATGGNTAVAYLFATKAGISKVGSYTGNGSSQTINCGFSTGARFILIKRTDSTGDWYVWDTARGIVSANDPHLSLNTTVAEVTTDDSVDPDNTGFIVNQVAATNINVNNATYIYLAIA